MIKKALALLLLTTACFSAEQVSLNSFQYLNSNENSLIIAPTESQDLLNVDVTPGGKSVKKRTGYGLYKALSTGVAVHGLVHFFDSTGNDVQIAGSSTSLYGIVADATPTQIVSSATLNSTWDCADTQGSAYCVNSNRNVYLKTDGATKTWFTTPLGTMVEATPDRVAVSGVSGTPNTIYFSESGTFTNYTVGLNPTSPFSEVIASQGSKVTHIRWACGKLLWWKDQSFGYLAGTDQFNLENNIVSDTVGSFDNSSALDPGGSVWFRGQDGHIWKYDCTGLTKESVKISPYVQASSKRVSNLWSQTSQSDFATGAVTFNSPSVAVSTTIAVGSVVVSSFSGTDTDSTTFRLGSAVNVTVSTFTIRISTNNAGSVENNGCETDNGGQCASWANMGALANWSRVTSSIGVPCTVNPRTGAGMFSTGLGASPSLPASIILTVKRTSDDFIVASTTSSINSALCSWTQATLTANPTFAGQRIKLELYLHQASGSFIPIYKTTSTYVYGSDITFYYNSTSNGSWPNLASVLVDDIVGGSSTITAGSFTSRTFDTAFSSSLARGLASWTVSTSTPIFALQHSTSTTGVWSTILTSTGSESYVNRYVRYVASFTVSGSDDANTTFDDASIVSASSGTYYSAVKNAPNLTQWSTFGASVQDNGGSQAFYVRSSTNAFTVRSSTPSWTSQSNGGLITVSTGTYFQARDDFSITSATSAPTLNEFSFNWFEGSASDQAYSIYFDNSIWWTVAYGAGQSTNNYIFKNDLINDGWTIYDFGTGGFSIQNNSLYFGSTSAGNLFKYGTQTSDNGTAISAYWKSKDFTGQDPWLENQYKQLDTYFARADNATVSVSYFLNTSTTSTSYNVGLSSATRTVIVNKKLLPSGKFGTTFNYKVSDSATTSQWELFGFRMIFEPQAYRPSN